MSTVCILTVGEYSDYRIIGVFSSTKKALKYATDTEEHDYQIETFFLDPDVSCPRPGMSLWEVKMMRNGDSSITGWHDSPEGQDAKRQSEVNLYYYPDKHRTFLKVVQWAKSKEHAVKIANEIRLQLIASGGWEEEE